jgi:hypothetical protein
VESAYIQNTNVVKNTHALAGHLIYTNNRQEDYWANGASIEGTNNLKPLILIAGATGYVGGELLEPLLAVGYPVRSLARRPEALAAKELSGLQVVRGDEKKSANSRRNGGFSISGGNGRCRP